MRRILLAAFFSCFLLLGQYSRAQSVCFEAGPILVQTPGGNNCAMVAQQTAGATAGVVADLSFGSIGNFQNLTYTGQLYGDLGQPVNDGTAATTQGCQVGGALHVNTIYSPGVHTVYAQFVRCGQYGPAYYNAQVMVVVLPPAPPPPDTPCGVSMIDPVNSVPKLWLGSQLVSRPSDLANAVGSVQGVAADGTAKILLRISSSDGANVTLNLVDGSGGSSTSLNEIGGLTAIGGGSPSISLPIVAHDDGYGAYAYALYQAPANFVRASVNGDSAAIQRTVQLQVACVTGGVTANGQSSVAIVRPPVILIHGLWSSASEAWQNFVPVKSAESALWTSFQQNSILAVNYDVPPDDVIASTSPAYSSAVITQITRNALGFSYNAPFVLQQVSDYLGNFRQTFNVAAVQADVVAHSMGGDIARTISGLSNFQNSDNYGSGSIHKLITIGTPHLGSPLATQLLAPANTCVATKFAGKGLVPLTSVTFQSSPPTSGAVADLENGVSGPITSPIAYIAGSALGPNLTGLDCGPLTTGTLCTAWQLRTACGSYPADPLANNLTSQNWPTIFGSSPNNANDAMVPQTSQLNGTSNLLLVFPYVIHSPAIEMLGFTGPSELDSASGIPDWVVDLLNEPTDGTEFRH